MKNIDEIVQGFKGILSYLLFVQDLYSFKCTKFNRTFLLFQFLTLFHSIIQFEKELISSSFVPI